MTGWCQNHAIPIDFCLNISSKFRPRNSTNSADRKNTIHQSLLVVSTVLCPDMVVMHFLIVYLIKHLDNDQRGILPTPTSNQLILIFTVCNSSCGKVMFSQVCVKNSVHRGVFANACWDTHPYLGRHPPQVDTPLDRHSPPLRRPLQRTVCILLECILV